MKKETAVQLFAILAVVIGLAVSYHPPDTNAQAIWGLVTFFLGTAIRELFGIVTTVVAPAATPATQDADVVGK